MKHLIPLFIIACLRCTAASAQVTFKVSEFSKDYTGEVFIADTAEVFSPGTIWIKDKKSGKTLVKVESEELAANLEMGMLKANVHELPYGEQSLIMYDDFNFDGIKDLSIEDGQNSCYHGASFQIYLATAGGFVLNDAFTRLAQEYCGMFEVDYTSKKLSTMTKSGCCWHQFTEYIVEHNAPKAIRITEEDMTGYPYSNTSEEVWNGTKMVKTRKRLLELESEGNTIAFSFVAEKNQKRVVLFTIDDNRLHYVLLAKDSTVEFAWPEDGDSDGRQFVYDAAAGEISFKNKDAQYVVYQKNGATGIRITAGGKVYDWPASKSSIKGKLTDAAALNAENVVMK